MIKLNEEYFQRPYYFYLKDKGDKIAVYYSVSNTIVESRKNDDVIVVDKDVFEDIQKVINNILKSGKKLSKEFVHKLLDSKAKSKQMPDGEIGELVNPDGSFISSSTPILNQRNLAKKTMDQTVRMTRANQFPFIRVYYGESQEEKNNLIDEENFSDAYGWEEMQEKNIKTFKGCMKVYHDLGVKDKDEAKLRCESLGFDPELDEEGLQRIVELEKEKMEKMIDEILITKKSEDKDFVKKNKEKDQENSVVEKILIRNIEAIKKLADKEGVDINKLIKKLKIGE